jgi:hypothetical protein
LVGLLLSGVAAARTEAGQAAWTLLTRVGSGTESAPSNVSQRASTAASPKKRLRHAAEAQSKRDEEELEEPADDGVDGFSAELDHVAPASTNRKPAPSPGQRSAKDRMLAEQVAAYKRATSNREPTVVVRELRAFKQRWPGSPLIHEVDLQIVAALQRAEDGDGARKAARDFLRDHPDTGRATEMQKLAGEQP